MQTMTMSLCLAPSVEQPVSCARASQYTSPSILSLVGSVIVNPLQHRNRVRLAVYTFIIVFHTPTQPNNYTSFPEFLKCNEYLPYSALSRVSCCRG